MKTTSRKVSKNNVHISTRQITSKKVRGNIVDFWTREITRVRGNNVDFSASEITSKKYVEMTWKFVEIWSSTYQCNIHVESTRIRRCVPVGKMPSFFLCKLQLITLLLLICNSYIRWSTRFVTLKLSVGFSIFGSVLFLL